MKKKLDIRKSLLSFVMVSTGVFLLFSLLYAVVMPDITATDTAPPETDLQVPFGYITVGSTSVKETLTIQNDGPGTLHVSDIQLMGTNVDDFVLDLVSAPLACGPAYMTSSGIVSKCNMTVSFVPHSEGSKAAYVRITSDDPDENPLDISLSGTGSTTAVPDIYVIDPEYPFSDLLLPFDSLETGLTSVGKTISIYNGGIGSLEVTDIQLTGTDASDFIVSAASTPLSCGPKVFTSSAPAYDDCGITVYFSPQTEGNKTAAVRITNTDPDESPLDVALTGTAIAASVPDIAATDTASPQDDLQVPFGSLSVGTTSLEEIISVQNQGSDSLKITNIQLTGANTDNFTIDVESTPMACGTAYMTSTGIVLGPAYMTSTTTIIDYCNMKVAFSPQSEGDKTAAVQITSDDPDENPLDISLSGTGSASPAPDIYITDTIAPVSDLNMDFGNVTALYTKEESITLSNAGNADLVLGNIASGNPLDSPFSIPANTCSGQSLEPAGNCTLTVSFAPQSAGNYTDSFDIPSNDPDESSVTINLAGTGSVVLAPDIRAEDTVLPLSDLQVPFGSATVGAVSAQETISIFNDGTVPLSVSNMQITGTNMDNFILDLGSDPLSCGPSYMTTIGVSSRCDMTVSFAPQSEGNKDAIIRITSDDPDESPLDLILSGKGLTTGQNNPPALPKLLYPANAQQGLPTELTLEWAAAKDPEADTVTYYIYVSEDPSFTGASPFSVGFAIEKLSPYAGAGIFLIGIVLTGSSARKRRQLALLLVILIVAGIFLVSCGSDGAGTGNSDRSVDKQTYTVTGLSPATKYYWKVVADDGNGNQTESAIWNFTTK